MAAPLTKATVTNVGWGLKCLTSDRPRQRAYEDEVGYRYYENACGQTVTIYVLDDLVHTSHSAFRKPPPPPGPGTPEMLELQKQFKEDQARHVEAKQFTNPDLDHGTFAAAIAAGRTYGVAREANVISRDYDPFEVLTGIFTARPAVVNISNDVRPAQVVELIKAGLHVVIAAGNSNIPKPAQWDLSEVPDDDKHHIESVIRVAASTMDDKRWGYLNDEVGTIMGSTYGPFVDLFAPGDNITSATHSDKNTYSKRENLRGSSFAAPHVTGIIACLLSDDRYSGLTPSQMKAKILAMAWPDVIEDAPILDLVKKVLPWELRGAFKEFGKGNTDWPLESEQLRKAQEDLDRLFKEKASRVKEGFLPEPKLLTERKVENPEELDAMIKGDVTRLEAKIKTLTHPDLAEKAFIDFKTTKRLASCRRERWENH